MIKYQLPQLAGDAVKFAIILVIQSSSRLVHGNLKMASYDVQYCVHIGRSDNKGGQENRFVTSVVDV